MTVAFFGMTAICLLLVGVIVLLVLSVDKLLEREKHERLDMHDRLMAVSQPVALVQTKAHQDPDPARITYVDEEREWELSSSGGGYGAQQTPS